MKNNMRNWWFILMACMGFTLQAFGQSGEVAGEGYYVVINAYAQSKEDYARRYYEKIQGDGDEVHYAYVPGKKMYFVYRQFHTDYRSAIEQMRESRKDPRFPDAWVFVSGEVVEDMSDRKNSTNKNQTEEAEIEENEKTPVISTPETVAEIDSVSENGELNENALEELNDRLEPPANVKQVVFILSNARNNEEVTGDVQIIDTERSKLINVQNSGEIATIADPENGTGNLTMICDVFGYRKDQKELNYQTFAENEDVQMVNDYYVVFFDLVRYHKGDIATMYNVYFYNDAAVMRPESRYEVNSLLNMMRENPNYKIRIHGHTNGNRSGTIISMGDSKNFFGLDDQNKDGSGSAKMLSKRRAEVIKSYLVSQGIEEGRMEIKAWGGRRMLYDKNSSLAKKNVRVEIEILEE
ncbi:OmpA family protein [Fulvivirga sedimenti]|uniref:OmpA family protein n=1 Tax=Fulvivirga sedimenti TaxID=2879465 RepID=A0A9X1KY48_9BACT|nr:OmpA family protein [Fulvivirga sedimenti]MCA6075463.1 OmpA family protein [Fulvivirga sedimenti]MCA6076640.1 OmpA family protein [Fulvivirga sedimenti]MCA6077768.1 OmpA family protein [Fulvivirga sedimenti]